MRIYRIAAGSVDPGATDREHAGAKAAGLATMAAAGLPVPPAFVIGTATCRDYHALGRHLPNDLVAEVDGALAWLEAVSGKKLGSAERPLLLSVRSGAAASMPGMMETILDLGINDEVAAGLARESRDGAFAWDCYRRFVQMFGEVALGVAAEQFEHAIDEARRGAQASEIELGEARLRELVARYRHIVRAASGAELPRDPREQLLAAIAAVLDSWNGERAVRYRTHFGLTHLAGTAVTVQEMVYGNFDERSAAGVGFTRDPQSGARELFGEYLPRAQGEEVVAGTRDPLPLARLRERSPELYRELERVAAELERLFGDMQDFEFTVERGQLFVLQSRAGKRSGRAAIVIATDIVAEGLISSDAALATIDPRSLEHLLHPELDPEARQVAEREGRLLARGLAAGPGAASGALCTSPRRAEELATRGRAVVLVRAETSADDVAGMAAARALLTARGGASSHAAIVGRQLGKPCVVGCGALRIDDAGAVTLGDRRVREGETLTVDGSSGAVYLGAVASVPSELERVLVARTLAPEASDIHRRYSLVMAWADAHRKLGVRANCDTPEDARAAAALGAEGIGLCRTEHMFFASDRLPKFQEAIVLALRTGADAALDEVLASLRALQEADFEGLFRAMPGKPVTIRLLDPPLHEFLPNDPTTLASVAARLGIEPAEVRATAAALREQNPMLGHRGCRLGVTHPRIYEMQVEAIVTAAAKCAAAGIAVSPQIMLPLVAFGEELRWLADRVRAAAERAAAGAGRSVPYRLGTMIEVPRAALVAGELAAVAEFFSFGTNDLTQMTMGLSRDDVGPVLALYLGPERQILASDPFQQLDAAGVGRLMRLAVAEGRAARADLEVGICGEHGGDPSSIALCASMGLDYVSANAARVPVARLAAAQASLRR